MVRRLECRVPPGRMMWDSSAGIERAKAAQENRWGEQCGHLWGGRSECGGSRFASRSIEVLCRVGPIQEHPAEGGWATCSGLLGYRVRPVREGWTVRVAPPPSGVVPDPVRPSPWTKRLPGRLTRREDAATLTRGSPREAADPPPNTSRTHSWVRWNLLPTQFGVATILSIKLGWTTSSDSGVKEHGQELR